MFPPQYLGLAELPSQDSGHHCVGRCWVLRACTWMCKEVCVASLSCAHVCIINTFSTGMRNKERNEKKEGG